MIRHFLLLYCIASLQTTISCGQDSSDVQLTSCCQTYRTCTADAQTRQDWKLAFRGTAGVGKSVYLAYRDGAGIPATVESGCKQVGQNLPCSNHYRNSAILDNWREISDVAFVVYKNNVKVKQVIFDGAGSTYLNWLDKSRVRESSWTDMKTNPANYFSIVGHQDVTLKRTFFMNQAYGTCPNDVGWFVALDGPGGCTWEQPPPYPQFKYSTSDTSMNWNDAAMGRADYFAVLVRYYNIP